MTFAVQEPRDWLIGHNEVYTLRPKLRKRGRGKTIREPLMTRIPEAPFGKGNVTFVKEIKNDSELQAFVSKSGFDTVAEWRAKAKDSRFLYYVNEFEDLSGPHP